MYLSPPRRATTEQMARSSRFCCWRRYGCRSGCIRVCEFANGMSVHCLMHPYEKRMTVLRFDLPVIFLLLFLGGKRDGAHHTQHTHTHWHAQAMARTPHTDTRTNIFPSMSLNFTENPSIRMLAPVRGAHRCAYICEIGKFRCGVVSVSVERVLTYAMRLPVCN